MHLAFLASVPLLHSLPRASITLPCCILGHLLIALWDLSTVLRAASQAELNSSWGETPNHGTHQLCGCHRYTCLSLGSGQRPPLMCLFLSLPYFLPSVNSVATQHVYEQMNEWMPEYWNHKTPKATQSHQTWGKLKMDLVSSASVIVHSLNVHMTTGWCSQQKRTPR